LLELPVAAEAAGMTVEEFTAAYIKLGLDVWIPQEGFMQVMLARVEQVKNKAIPEAASPPEGAVSGRTYSYGEAKKLLKVQSYVFTELRSSCGIPRGHRSGPRLTEEQFGRLREALKSSKATESIRAVSSGEVFTNARRCAKEWHVNLHTLRVFKRKLGIPTVFDGKSRGLTRDSYEKLKEHITNYKLKES
jgi:hypothetical protein